MSLKNLVLVTVTVLFFQISHSQRNYEGYNRLGITGGMTLFDIQTSNFNTKQGTGFAFGFTTRGSFRNNFDLIYGITFYNTALGIEGSKGVDTQFIDYQIQAAQIGLLGSYNIVKHHLSLEFGPILNVNGKMKLKSDNFEDYVLDGHTTLTAKDVQDISKVNFHVAGGLTAGLENFRLSAQYQYGVTNTLNKLNDKENIEKNDFKGNSSTITLSGTIYF